jgi:hypothetical protein
MWQMNYLVPGLTRFRRIGKVANAAFFWVRNLDRLMTDADRSDGASFTTFFGGKPDVALTPKGLIAEYRGAQI